MNPGKHHKHPYEVASEEDGVLAPVVEVQLPAHDLVADLVVHGEAEAGPFTLATSRPSLPPFRVWAEAYLEHLGDRRWDEFDADERAIVQCISLAHTANAWTKWPKVFVVVAKNRQTAVRWCEEDRRVPIPTKICVVVTREHDLIGEMVSPRQHVRLVDQLDGMTPREARAIARQIEFSKRRWHAMNRSKR